MASLRALVGSTARRTLQLAPAARAVPPTRCLHHLYRAPASLLSGVAPNPLGVTAADLALSGYRPLLVGTTSGTAHTKWDTSAGTGSPAATGLHGTLFKGVKPAPVTVTELSDEREPSSVWASKPLGERYRDPYFTPTDGLRLTPSVTEAMAERFLDGAEESFRLAEQAEELKRRSAMRLTGIFKRRVPKLWAINITKRRHKKIKLYKRKRRASLLRRKGGGIKGIKQRE